MLRDSGVLDRWIRTWHPPVTNCSGNRQLNSDRSVRVDAIQVSYEYHREYSSLEKDRI